MERQPDPEPPSAGDRNARPAARRAPRTNGRARPAASASAADDLRLAIRLLRTKAALRVQRTSTAVQAAAGRVAMALWLVIVIAVATVAGVLGVFLGLRGAVADWAGRQWVGDLAAGALFLFGLAAALAAVLARQRRSRLAELRRRFGPLARPGDGTSLAPRAGPPRPATPRAPTRRKQDDT